MRDSSTYTRPPRQGEIAARAATTAGEVFQTPTAWLGRSVIFYAQACDIWLLTGENSGVSVVAATKIATSPGASGSVLNMSAGAPKVAVAGQTVKITFGKNDTWFAICNDNTSGYWHAHLADHGPGVPG